VSEGASYRRPTRVERMIARHEAEQAVDRSVRRLPALAREGLALAWSASPRRLVLTFVLSVLTASGLAGMVVVSRSVFSEVLEAADKGTGASAVAGTLLIFVAVASFNQLVSALSGVQSQLLGYQVARESEARVLEATTRVPLEQFEEPVLHERIVQAAGQASSAPMESVNAVQTLTAGVLSLLAMGTILTSFQPLLVPVLGVAAAVSMWLSSRNALDRYVVMLETVQATQRRWVMRQLLVERDRAKEVRAFTLREALLMRWRAAYDEELAVRSRQVVRQAKRNLLSAALTGLISGIGWLALLGLFVRGDLTLPETAAAGFAFQAARNWLGRITTALSQLYSSSLFFDNYRDFVELGRSLDAGAREREVTTVMPFSSLDLQGVSFRYPGASRAAVDDVSLTLRAGEVVALVGENGSGKTTLSKVLAQLYSPTEGSVTWDGVDTSSIDPEALRRHIAVIFQDFNRYELSAQENIGFGDVARVDDIEAVRAAAVDAGAHRYLDALGYDTVLSPRLGGVDLSGGQWQRIALARGFFRDAPFLVLDEPTSALDARAEKELFDRIRELTHGRTVLLVSHRFSTVRSADRILVMHEGRVVEEGTHAELMALGGGYAELYTLQASAFVDPVPG